MSVRVAMPLTDITNVRALQGQKMSYSSPAPLSFHSALSPLSPAPVAKSSYTHNPYGWKCLPDDEHHAAMITAQRMQLAVQHKSRVVVPFVPAVMPLPVPETLFMEDKDQAPPTPSSPAVCRALVQFKCHQTEFSSPIMVDKGQYVVVQGDRGIDIGVIVRVNTEAQKSYVERTGPTGSILRHATQREVDYWATDLKGDEATALEFCRQRIIRHHLQMEVRHAEYQFDKKKLTFYYDAKARVDFVQLLKELYREFGCRIWMEKVRGAHEQ